MTPVEPTPPMNDLHRGSAETVAPLDEAVYAPPVWHDGSADQATRSQLEPRRFAVALTVSAGAVNLGLFLFAEAAQSFANRHVSFFGDQVVWLPALWLGCAATFGVYFVKIRAYWRVVAVVQLATVLYWSYRLLLVGCLRCAESG